MFIERGGKNWGTVKEKDETVDERDETKVWVLNRYRSA